MQSAKISPGEINEKNCISKARVKKQTLLAIKCLINIKGTRITTPVQQQDRMEKRSITKLL